jgi:hypothetical protein
LKGASPTIARAMIVNGTQLSSYSQSKEVLIENFGFKDGIQVHFFSSMLAGFLTTLTSLPIDIVKTRYFYAKYLLYHTFNKVFSIVYKRVQKSSGSVNSIVNFSLNLFNY